MWIREGLEKLEKKKQKKQDHAEEGEPKKTNLNLSGSASNIAGYDHGKVHSPVRSPKSNDSDEVCVHRPFKCFLVNPLEFIVQAQSRAFHDVLTLILQYRANVS